MNGALQTTRYKILTINHLTGHFNWRKFFSKNLQKNLRN